MSLANVHQSGGGGEPRTGLVANTWQTAEAIIPLNREGGRMIGVKAHLFHTLAALRIGCIDRSDKSGSGE